MLDSVWLAAEVSVIEPQPQACVCAALLDLKVLCSLCRRRRSASPASKSGHELDALKMWSASLISGMDLKGGRSATTERRQLARFLPSVRRPTRHRPFHFLDDSNNQVSHPAENKTAASAGWPPRESRPLSCLRVRKKSGCWIREIGRASCRERVS